VWRVPGNNRIAGTYRGIDEVVAYMRRRRELASATFRMHPREVLVGPTHQAAVTDGTVNRDGTTHTWSTIGLYRIRDGRISECSLVPLDAAAFDQAWG
jgi:ketosteroid isomerase-like protein